MPFLWDVGQKPKTNQSIRPSPKRKNNSFFGGFIEGASLPAFLQRKLCAGMTVEAAIVLPLFIFFLVNLGSAMEMIRLHGNMQLALWDVGNRMCVYGYVSTMGRHDNETDPAKEANESGGLMDEMGEIALTYTYVKGQVVDYVGEEYLEESPITNGSAGLQFWESEVGEQETSAVSGDILDIVMTYQVSPLLEIPYVKPFRMSNRYYGRLWTGYDLKHREDLVYVAENASVYHESPSCTHLKLTIRQVFLIEALNARNENGGRYSECSKCGDGEETELVFIAREGDYYHKERQCPGLKRTIFSVPRSEAEAKYESCSRCGAH